METVTRRTAVREGYAVLLLVHLSLSYPAKYPRLADYTVRYCEERYTALLEQERERVREAYQALKSNVERSRWRVEHVRITAMVRPLSNTIYQVICTEERPGSDTVSTVWLWQVEEQTMLPPSQIRRFLRGEARKHRTSTKN